MKAPGTASTFCTPVPLCHFPQDPHVSSDAGLPVPETQLAAFGSSKIACGNQRLAMRPYGVQSRLWLAFIVKIRAMLADIMTSSRPLVRSDIEFHASPAIQDRGHVRATICTSR